MDSEPGQEISTVESLPRTAKRPNLAKYETSIKSSPTPSVITIWPTEIKYVVSKTHDNKDEKATTEFCKKLETSDLPRLKKIWGIELGKLGFKVGDFKTNIPGSQDGLAPHSSYSGKGSPSIAWMSWALLTRAPEHKLELKYLYSLLVTWNDDNEEGLYRLNESLRHSLSVSPAFINLKKEGLKNRGSKQEGWWTIATMKQYKHKKEAAENAKKKNTGGKKKAAKIDESEKNTERKAKYHSNNNGNPRSGGGGNGRYGGCRSTQGKTSQRQLHNSSDSGSGSNSSKVKSHPYEGIQKLTILQKFASKSGPSTFAQYTDYQVRGARMLARFREVEFYPKFRKDFPEIDEYEAVSILLDTIQVEFNQERDFESPERNGPAFATILHAAYLLQNRDNEFRVAFYGYEAETRSSRGVEYSIRGATPPQEGDKLIRWESLSTDETDNNQLHTPETTPDTTPETTPDITPETTAGTTPDTTPETSSSDRKTKNEHPHLEQSIPGLANTQQKQISDELEELKRKVRRQELELISPRKEEFWSSRRVSRGCRRSERRPVMNPNSGRQRSAKEMPSDHLIEDGSKQLRYGVCEGFGHVSFKLCAFKLEFLRSPSSPRTGTRYFPAFALFLLGLRTWNLKVPVSVGRIPGTWRNIVFYWKEGMGKKHHNQHRANMTVIQRRDVI